MLKVLKGIRRRARGLATLALMAACAALSSVSTPALAHGERNQEPFLRMRTAHFYDVKWSTDETPVNGQIVITGKFRLFPDWPANLAKPDVAFLGNGTPGPVLARVESYINGVPAIQSSKLELDRDYEFKTVLVGRLPGLHHVHPMLNVQGAGPLLGPGNWLTVTGSHDDFRLPATTLTGQKIDNLETWGMDRVYGWNALWFAIALAWLLWWLRRPLLIPRMRALTEKGGNRAELVTRLDYILGAALIAVTIAIVAIGFMMTEDEYPRTVPLQASRAVVEPLPQQKEAVSVKVEKSTYDVPGRSLKFVLTLTNKGDAPVQIGEFMTSNLRFINHDVPAAMKGVDPKYPKDLLPPTGLFVSDNSPLAPGETRTINMDATDAAWEVERLTSLINDPDNTMGGLLFFFDAKGNRSISDIGGAMTPVFTTADGRS